MKDYFKKIKKYFGNHKKIKIKDVREGHIIISWKVTEDEEGNKDPLVLVEHKIWEIGGSFYWEGWQDEDIIEEEVLDSEEEVIDEIADKWNMDWR